MTATLHKAEQADLRAEIRHASMLLIDDPAADEPLSATDQERVKEWYRLALASRP